MAPIKSIDSANDYRISNLNTQYFYLLLFKHVIPINKVDIKAHERIIILRVYYTIF